MSIDLLKEYVNDLKRTKVEEKTEFADRDYLKKLINKIKPNSNIQIQNEPKRNKEGLGAPDFIVKNNESIVGYIEAKKIEQNLDDTLRSPQIEKYKQLSNNILLTNYIEFIWISKGNVVLREILIFKTDLEKHNTKIDPIKSEKVTNILNQFLESPIEKITSVEKLASLLAKRTKTLKELVEQTLNLNLSLPPDKHNTLTGTYNILKKRIYNDNFKADEFADSIAQTITYGFFLAKLNNTSNLIINFNNIKQFIPNNFALIQDILRLVDNIASSSEYKNIKWILEEIINIINNIDTEILFKEFSFAQTYQESLKDPYLYFYEDFLTQYDKHLRKSKGVYYTPYCVVNFIVNSLNNILKHTFDLENGFATREEVTVLDFATGTGTFLLEVIKCILKEVPKESGKQQDYITSHILKNIYGFEYLMAPYAVAHFKLFQYLKEICNFKFENENERLKIFLTNTLDLTEKTSQVEFQAFLPAISEENKLVNEVKNKPILVILGNPPYNVGSKNNNNHILKLMKAYKAIENKQLDERAIISLNDDYVKFIRFSEHKIENASEGLLGIITNNGYLDNVTFRGMRYHLLKTFDEIYILNLHGNSRKKEKTDDGDIDENIFDIQTGVAIGIFIKNKTREETNKLANVFYKNIKGTKIQKYAFLDSNDIFSINTFEKLNLNPPYYFFVKKNLVNVDTYNKGISLKDIFSKYSVGILSGKDKIAIDFTKEKLLFKLNDLAYLSEQDARYKYGLGKDTENWNLLEVQKFLKSTNIDEKHVQNITYRPFDNRFIYYSKSKGVVARPLYKTMQHILDIEDNIALATTRFLSTDSFKHIFITSNISEGCLVSNKTKEASYFYPLFIKEEHGALGNVVKDNFTESFRNFIDTKYPKKFKPQKILAYIYAILNSNTYKTKFYEFLKIDFPKIIFTDEIETFESLSRLGNMLISAHLLKTTGNVDKNIGMHISLNDNDKHIVEKIQYRSDTEELYYNNNSKFINVPYNVYNFFIGSYQVLHSYLKYRKGRYLSIDEIEHIEKIIRVVYYTIDIQHQIDLITCNLKEFNT
ncbi:DNA methyltransferase (plasmid) [Borrelia turcica IST7]|uniref:site-specific DNA-methyltransferase (adenine-specific) n=1 Tax=Borrelia turcica IST7 TaxID=1104446 RepID=A0A386PPR9_9SPIR|nr:type ISP restriction/modification enzyme [Borrelia turcica]AYE36923.1 DNA methyltransferase [Borrelia turcica IST7]